jgi:glutamyl-tRNA synthetase
VVRLEDTDLERNVAGSEEGILEDLRWLGLLWDEGPDREGPFGPYRQSERGALYSQAAEDLVSGGMAYPCFCSEAELESDSVALEGGRRVQKYPGRCRGLTPGEREARFEAGERPLIRFRVPEERIEIKDEIRGPISFDSYDFDDFVLLRRDGRPTYNFAVVVDDLHMAITHVIRGAGHLSNTPKQVLLYHALDREPPAFIHLPTVLGPDHKKLSKRSGAEAVSVLRQEGYHPDAVVNYLSLLGWSHPQGKEVMTPEELVAAVSVERLGASDTVFDPTKMLWMSQQHFGMMDGADFVDAAEAFLDRERFPVPDEGLSLALQAIQSRTQVLSEVNLHMELLYPQDEETLARVRAEVRNDPSAAEVVGTLLRTLEADVEWNPGELGNLIRATGKELGVRGPALFHPIRKALTGLESGPDLGMILSAIGPADALARLRKTLL